MSEKKKESPDVVMNDNLKDLKKSKDTVILGTLLIYGNTSRLGVMIPAEDEIIKKLNELHLHYRKLDTNGEHPEFGNIEQVLFIESFEETEASPTDYIKIDNNFQFNLEKIDLLLNDKNRVAYKNILPNIAVTGIDTTHVEPDNNLSLRLIFNTNEEKLARLNNTSIKIKMDNIEKFNKVYGYVSTDKLIETENKNNPTVDLHAGYLSKIFGLILGEIRIPLYLRNTEERYDVKYVSGINPETYSMIVSAISSSRTRELDICEWLEKYEMIDPSYLVLKEKELYYVNRPILNINEILADMNIPSVDSYKELSEKELQVLLNMIYKFNKDRINGNFNNIIFV